MKTIIITNCTNRKRLHGLQPVAFQGVRFTSVTAMAKSWQNQINEQRTSMAASKLYVGRSVSDAKYVAKKLNARLMFVSTGLGLIDSDSKHPPYNLTINSTPNSILPYLKKLEAHASDWWEAINSIQAEKRTLSSLISAHDVNLVMIALSSSYIQLIKKDLAQIKSTDIEKLRIFTSRPGLKILPEHLQVTVMPYDDRLESSQLPGTRNDFPQRALRHFIDVLDLSTASNNEAKTKVSLAMSQLSIATKITRRRLPDHEISSLLKSSWVKHNGSSTHLLRYLRDVALVSCEQSRFRKIWLDVKKQKQYTGEV